jgi:hypothetical protein
VAAVIAGNPVFWVAQDQPWMAEVNKKLIRN